MKRPDTIITTASLFCICLMACYKKVNIKIPDIGPHLVVHSYTATGDSFRVAVNKTIPPDPDPVPVNETYVENALVVLSQNGSVADTLLYDSRRRRYVSRTAIAEQGQVYTIAVAAPGFTTVVATATAPYLVRPLDVIHTPEARTTISGNVLDDVTFTLHDPSAVQNYYISALYSSLLNSGSMCVYSYDPAIEKSKGDLLPFEQDDCLESEEVLMSDKSFNGFSKTITLSGSHFDLTSWQDQAGQWHRAYLKLYNISEDYYLYLKQRISLEKLEDEFLSFSNPATPRGNIKNGYGIFTVFAVSVDSLGR